MAFAGRYFVRKHHNLFITAPAGVAKAGLPAHPATKHAVRISVAYHRFPAVRHASGSPASCSTSETVVLAAAWAAATNAYTIAFAKTSGRSQLPELLKSPAKARRQFHEVRRRSVAVPAHEIRPTTVLFLGRECRKRRPPRIGDPGRTSPASSFRL